MQPITHSGMTPDELELASKIVKEGKLRLLGYPFDTIQEMYDLEAEWGRLLRRIKLLEIAKNV